MLEDQNAITGESRNVNTFVNETYYKLSVSYCILARYDYPTFVRAGLVYYLPLTT